MGSPLDALWRWGDRFSFVRSAGTSAEATHLNHSLVCALGAGLGVMIALAFHQSALTGARLAWTAFWLAYLARESRQHGRSRWEWDGAMDVAVPLCWGVVGLAHDMRQLVTWLAISAVLGVGYTVARPAPPKDA